MEMLSYSNSSKLPGYQLIDIHQENYILHTFASIWTFIKRIVILCLTPVNIFYHVKPVTRVASTIQPTEDCGQCSRCILAKRRRLQAKCKLIEDYIAENLIVSDQLEQVLSAQALNINRQLSLLKNLNSASEHLKEAIADCLEKHTSCITKFTSDMNNLEAKQEIDEKVAIARFEENTSELKRNLLASLVNTETQGIITLLDD